MDCDDILGKVLCQITTGSGYKIATLVCKKWREITHFYHGTGVKFANNLWTLVEKFPDEPWNWVRISRNPNISWEIIAANLDKPWNWRLISENTFRR